VTEDPEEAIHYVKHQLCIRGYENKFHFKTLKVAIVEKDGIVRGVPIEDQQTQKSEPDQNNQVPCLQ